MVGCQSMEVIGGGTWWIYLRHRGRGEQTELQGKEIWLKERLKAEKLRSRKSNPLQHLSSVPSCELLWLLRLGPIDDAGGLAQKTQRQANPRFGAAQHTAQNRAIKHATRRER